MSPRTPLVALALLTAALACAGPNATKPLGTIDGDPAPVTPASASEVDEGWEADHAACTACLNEGKTWQPEAHECTHGCEIMDISCYRDACPKRCSEDCGSCFGEAACRGAGCEWHQAAEAMWCTR